VATVTNPDGNALGAFQDRSLGRRGEITVGKGFAGECAARPEACRGEVIPLRTCPPTDPASERYR
jgi:hypothetical protein